MPTFILNDETQTNSYGFRVKNSGGSFARFDNNPVMLDSHKNDSAHVLGNWRNRRFEGSLLKADTNFDLQKASAKEAAGQVDRGFIKGCSMGLGISFDESSWQKGADGVPELIKWELMEASICAVPSNANALALFDRSTGKPISNQDARLNLAALSGSIIAPLFSGSNSNSKFSHVLTVDDFVNLSDADKLDMRDNHRAEYLALFGKPEIKRKPGATPEIGPATMLSYGHITALDAFMELSDGDKWAFKNKHNDVYLSFFKKAETTKSTSLAAPTLTSYSHITTLNAFMELSDGDKWAFKNKHNDVYLGFFN